MKQQTRDYNDDETYFEDQGTDITPMKIKVVSEDLNIIGTFKSYRDAENFVQKYNQEHEDIAEVKF